MMPEQPPGRTAPRDGEAPLRHMLLTGASRGIGHATVKLFQERGWRILTVSRQPFSEACAWPNARESHIQADISDLVGVDLLKHGARIAVT